MNNVIVVIYSDTGFQYHKYLEKYASITKNKKFKLEYQTFYLLMYLQQDES